MNNNTLCRDLKPLSKKVLAIIVEEGEARVAAQLTVATSADQRALTFAGFTITTSTAAVGGLIYLYDKNPINISAIIATFILAFGLMIAAVLSIMGARSTEFYLSGSSPSSRIPSDWQCGLVGPHSWKQAILEKASCLDVAIKSNASSALRVGKLTNASIYVAIGTVGIGLLILIHKTFAS